MIKGLKENEKKVKENEMIEKKKQSDAEHLGSSNAFEETENPFSKDADNISDEKLDELLED
jgi:hypothetical protein